MIRRLLDLDAEKRRLTPSFGTEIRFVPDRIAPARLADDPRGLTDFLLSRLLVVQPRPITRNAVLEAVGLVPAPECVALAVRLILASPEYQVE